MLSPCRSTSCCAFHISVYCLLGGSWLAATTRPLVWIGGSAGAPFTFKCPSTCALPFDDGASTDDSFRRSSSCSSAANRAGSPSTIGLLIFPQCGHVLHDDSPSASWVLTAANSRGP